MRHGFKRTLWSWLPWLIFACSAIEVLYHRRIFTPPICDVILENFHSHMERLTRLTYILKATPPARIEVMDVMKWIYFITRRRRALQYVRDTGQPLHMRINGHQYDFALRRTKDFPMVEHFSSETHQESDMVVTATELARSRDTSLRKIRESRWIRTLGTSIPPEMNLRDDSL